MTSERPPLPQRTIPANAGAGARIIARYDRAWIIWVASSGSPVATRRGCQRPPEGDTAWTQTVIADNWRDLERQLAEQHALDHPPGDTPP
jgi:hypothetical protein